jgi:hypothetical protein
MAITRFEEYISSDEFEALYAKARDVKNLIGGFVRYLEQKMGSRRSAASRTPRR